LMSKNWPSPLLIHSQSLSPGTCWRPRAQADF
jgi:hypothetical protein